MMFGDLDSYMQKNETQSLANTMYKNNLKTRTYIRTYISQNTIRVLEGNIGRRFSDIPQSNIFTDIFPRANDIKETINKWDLIKLKNICMAKGNSIKMKREPTLWENIFANDTSDKGLISKIYKEFM